MQNTNIYDHYNPYMQGYYDNGEDDLNNEQLPSFNKGGVVEDDVIYPDLSPLSELLRKQGGQEDTILAHINPIEASILKSIGGSGEINPVTGLPQYGFFKNPLKAIKGALGGVGGAVIGNMIMPGIGGVIGGALGGAAGSAMRGRKDFGSAALRGGMIGASLPTAASLAGSGVNALGMQNLGAGLSKYGADNTILPSLGLGSASSSASMSTMPSSSYLPHALLTSQISPQNASEYVQQPEYQQLLDNRSFLEKLGDNASNYLTKPGNLLTLGATSAMLAGRKKPKSPEAIAELERRYRNASRPDIAEIEADDAVITAREDLKKKRKSKKLKEDMDSIGTINRKVNNPEEFARTGRWLEYYDEEDNPVRMKHGGFVDSPSEYSMKIVNIPSKDFSLSDFLEYGKSGNMMSEIINEGSGYIEGETKGQDDLIDAKLSDGEFVIPADIVSDLGDGNNEAGAKELYKFMKNVRMHKRREGDVLPPKSFSVIEYFNN